MTSALLLLALASADVRVRLYTITAPSSAVINGTMVKAPLKPTTFPAPVRLEIKGSRPLTLNGPLEVSATASNKLKLIHSMPLERYVAAVLAGETNGAHSDEFLKAMAVAIRTYAVRFQGKAHEGHDFCDTTHCQDLRLSAVSQHHLRITQATEGLMLWDQGKVAATYYHAHCGGHSASSPHGRYLPAKPDPYCTAKGNDVWQAHYTRTELGRALSQATVADLKVTKRSESGRAETVSVNGKAVHSTTFMNAINRRFGWRVKSLLFDVREEGAGFVITGRGRGHGQGLCQIGAMRMAETGKSFREILAFYYPGAKLGLTAQGIEFTSRRSERLELLTTQPDRDQPLLATAEQALQEAERRTLMTWPRTQPIQLKLFPSVETYRNATTGGGAVAASTLGRVIRLQPRPTREVLLHEFTHVLLEANTKRTQPWWFREGLAQHLAGDAHANPQYTHARQRVEDLIRRHGRDRVLAFWREGLPPTELATLRP